MIFYKKDTILGVDLESSINNAVFPGLQVRCYSSLSAKYSFAPLFIFILCNLLVTHLYLDLHLIISIVLQGGPHNHTIGGLAVCLKHAKSQEFKAYQNAV